jgi:1-acyl-sn-glycerol-3-phosphate acyltransferase
VGPVPALFLPAGVRIRLAIQREIGRLLSPLTTVAVAVLLRLWLGLRLENADQTRSCYRQLRAQSDTPLLICANHLTMIDSALIAWALGTPLWYVRHFSALPWNVPERRHFASTWPRRVLAYVYKCVPIVRGGRREEVAGTLARFTWLLSRGNVGLIFPEGGRSRSGRVEVENAAWGVGRIVRSLPGCRVLCVYARGDRQVAYTGVPASGDLIRVSVSTLEPKSDRSGVRGSREVALQITGRLAEMEQEYFDARQ